MIYSDSADVNIKQQNWISLQYF